MNRNQKIGLGCGIAGCLGLIVIVVVVIVLAGAGILALPGLGSSNRNDNSNVTSSSNANDNSNANSNTNSTSFSSSTMSEDGKHKLVQAAGMTKDSALMEKVLRKLGFINATGVSDEYQQFLKDHPAWAMKNIQFIRSLSSEDAARAYVDAHIND